MLSAAATRVLPLLLCLHACFVRRTALATCAAYYHPGVSAAVSRPVEKAEADATFSTATKIMIYTSSCSYEYRYMDIIHSTSTRVPTPQYMNHLLPAARPLFLFCFAFALL
jgi:hypothetical protein